MQHLKMIADILTSIQKEDSLTLLTISDMHLQSAFSEKADKIIQSLYKLTSSVAVDAIVDLGDNLAMLGRSKHVSNDYIRDELSQIFKRMKESVNCPLILVNGNHDGVGTDFFMPDFWNGIVKNSFVHNNAIWHKEGACFYVDFTKAKTRLIVLSIPHDSEIRTNNPRPQWLFGREQLQWLANTALQTDFDVLLATHVPFFYNCEDGADILVDTWDGEKETLTFLNELCGRIDDYQEAVAVLSAFDNPSDYSNPKLGVPLVDNDTRGQVIACISGHTHHASTWEPYERRGHERNPLPCFQVVIEAAKVTHDNNDGLMPMDIVVWSQSVNELVIIHTGHCCDGNVFVEKMSPLRKQ